MTLQKKRSHPLGNELPTGLSNRLIPWLSPAVELQVSHRRFQGTTNVVATVKAHFPNTLTINVFRKCPSKRGNKRIDLPVDHTNALGNEMLFKKTNERNGMAFLTEVCAPDMHQPPGCVNRNKICVITQFGIRSLNHVTGCCVNNAAFDKYFHWLLRRS